METEEYTEATRQIRKGAKQMKIKLPIGSIILMLIFLIGGTIIMAVDLPGSFLNLGTGPWIVGCFGYIFLILAAVYFVVKE